MGRAGPPQTEVQVFRENTSATNFLFIWMPNWPGEPRFRLMLDGISATEWLKRADFCYVNRTTKPGYLRATPQLSVRLTGMRMTVNEVSSHLHKTYSEHIVNI